MKINKIRNEIDRIDSEIIELLSKRSKLVSEAGKTKKSQGEVSDPERVEKVIHKIRRRSSETGLDPLIAEKIYRCIITCFINREMEEFRELDFQFQDV